MNAGRVLRGRLLCPRPEEARVDEIADGLISVDAAGRITAVEVATDG